MEDFGPYQLSPWSSHAGWSFNRSTKRKPCEHIQCQDRSPDYEEVRIAAISVSDRDGADPGYGAASVRRPQCIGVGLSRLSAAEHNFEGVGSELAIARALSDLGRRLVAHERHDEDTR